jgi:hypothetical protein
MVVAVSDAAVVVVSRRGTLAEQEGRGSTLGGMGEKCSHKLDQRCSPPKKTQMMLV